MAGSNKYGGMNKKDLHILHARYEVREYEKRKKQRRKESFGSQEIDVSDYIFSPEGWEGAMFFFYFLSIPYIVGVMFLFLFVAGANIENFLIIEFDAFFIVWAIGYEIVASMILVAIFLSYLKFLSRCRRSDNYSPYCKT